MSEESVKTIVARYTKADYYRKVAATGAAGGPLPTGSLLVNFFLESKNLPNKTTIDIKTDGSFKEVFEDSDEYTREMQVGIVLDANVAKSVGQWLIERSEEILTLGKEGIKR